MLINEKDVVKNVNTATVNGMPDGTVAQVSAARSVERRARLGSLIVGVFSAVVVSLAALPAATQARQVSGLGDPVQLSSLPVEAQQTEQRILAGGPFPYSRDGVVFGNYEKRLDRHPRGYYHEYTVPTPGARTRGARRIICGGAKITEPDACFYTEDHYNSFHRIVK